MVVVGVRNVSVRDWYPMLLHSSNIRQRGSRRHTIKTWETNITTSVLNSIAVQISQRSARADLRCDILMSKESLVASITTWLLRKRISLPIGTDRISLCTMNTNADKISGRQRWIRCNFSSLRRISTKDRWNINTNIL